MVGESTDGDRLQGYVIDLDLAIEVDDKVESIKKGPSTRYRTGTAPFIALDLLRRPEAVNFPTWHLPRFDIESFIWVFTWVLHHYSAPVALSNGTVQRAWKAAPDFDSKFNIDDGYQVKATKLLWANSRPSNLVEVDSSFDSLKPLMRTLLDQVIQTYKYEDDLIESNPNADEGEFVDLNGLLDVDNILQILEQHYNAMEDDEDDEDEDDKDEDESDNEDELGLDVSSIHL